MPRGIVRKLSGSLVRNVSICALLIKLNDMTKYVELVVEDLRTRVRFPPTPPLLVVALPSINNEPLKEYSLKGFFYF